MHGLVPRALGTPMLALSVALAASAAGCGAFRVLFPSSAKETEAPLLPADLPAPAILVFSKTNGYRHHEAIDAGLARIREIAERRGWSIYHTESGAAFAPDLLARFDAAVWLNTSGDVLNDDQKTAFKSWIEQGGGFVGIHGAGGDTSYVWRWYVEELIGAQFIGHTMGPQLQTATVFVEDSSHPATRALPERWSHVEEWYSFEASPRSKPGVHVLVSVDESTYSPRLEMLWIDRDIAMGDHPVVWTRCQAEGRTFFSALGHQAAAYSEPEYAAVIEGAIAWAAGLEGEGCR